MPGVLAVYWQLLAAKKQVKQGNKNEFSYTPARLVESETEPYVVYYIWHVQKKQRVRKRVKLIGATPEAKRKDAAEVIKEINRGLRDGWHIDETAPPEPKEEPKMVQLVAEPVLTFVVAATIYKQVKSRELREDTTMGLYDLYLRHFTDFLKTKKQEQIRLKDIKPKLAFEFFDSVKTGGRFYNNMLGFYKSFATFFIDREDLQANPFSKLKNVRVDESDDHRPFNADQTKELRAAIVDSGNDQLWLFCQFIYFLFLRPGKELRYLRVGDILEKRVKVVSGTAKNRKTGYVDIPAALEVAIQKHRLRNYRPTDYVFTINGHPGPEPVGVNYFYKRHRAVLETLNLFGLDYDLYSWKPTGAVALYRATKDILLVQRHCRHSTPDQTYTYLRKAGLVFEGQDMSNFPAIWD
jgi:integrase